MSDLSLARPGLDVMAPADMGAEVAALDLRGMVILRGDLSDAGFGAALDAATGCAVPDTRRTTDNADMRVLWMSVDELMVFCDYAKAGEVVATFMEKASDAHVLAVNVSDARAVFSVSGEKAHRVLMKGAPVDVAAMETGEVRRTRIATVAVGLTRTGDDAFEVFCFRSYGAYMWNWLTVAAGSDSLSDL
jgi:sarcosine oxidase subunit gamma